MKLIDLLVQELPKRGGWPEGAAKAASYSHIPGVHFWDGDGFRVDFSDLTTRTLGCEEVTSEQYGWDGTGLPTVECECEYISNGVSWGKVKVIGFDDEKIVIRPSGEIYYAITPSNKDVFTPLRTEAERKRYEAAEAIDFYLPEFITDTPNEFYHAKKIYDAIAAGKIPGVKLED